MPRSKSSTIPSARPSSPGTDAVTWLLHSRDPSIRYRALTELLGEPPRARPVKEVSAQIPSGPKVRVLLRGQCDDGSFGVRPYRKWTGGFWRLLALADLAISIDDRRVWAAAEHMLRCLLAGDGSFGSLRNPKRISGRVRWHATQEGLALAVCCRLGMGEDPRLRQLAQWLVEWQWPDGGWNCDERAEADHSSFHETWGPARGLLEYHKLTGEQIWLDTAVKAVEFLLRHRLFRSDATGNVIHPEWVKIHYPPYWHYDALQGLQVCGLASRLGDMRAADALDLLESKRRKGRWRADGGYWRNPQAHTNMEVVDWGDAGEIVTLHALLILESAGRMRI